MLIKQASVYSSHLFWCVCLFGQCQSTRLLSLWRQRSWWEWLTAHSSVFFKVFSRARTSVCVGRCARTLGPQIPSDSWSQAFCINACLPLSPLFLISPLISPFPTFHASLPSDPILCVVYTLHLVCSPSILSPFLPLPDVGKGIALSFDFYSSPPSSSNLVTRPWLASEEQKRSAWKMEKWGLYSCSSFPFLLLICRFFCRKGEFVAHIWEEKREKKKKRCGGGRDGTEQQGTETERESESDFFFWRVVRPCQSQRKEGTRGERKNAEVSNLFISLKKVTVVYQLTIHSYCCTSLRLPSLCLLFCLSLYFPPSPLERAFTSGLANLL